MKIRFNQRVQIVQYAIKQMKLWICHCVSRHWRTFSQRMHRNGYTFRSFRLKICTPFNSATSTSYKTGIFPLSDDVCGIYLMCSNFTWPCVLDLWPFDLNGVSYIKLHTPNIYTNFEHPTIICSRVMDDSTWLHYNLTNGHCACTMSRNILPVSKNVHIFEIADPNLSFQFVTLRALRQRLNHVRQKIAFIPLWRLQSSAQMHSAHVQYHVNCAYRYIQIYRM